MSGRPLHRTAVLFRRTAAMLLVMTASSSVALAQSAPTASDKAAAEALFDQGRDAMKRGDFAQACGLLERSQRVDPAVGTLLYLAECYEKSGRTASAWATFREAADAADAAHEAPRAKAGRERAARLEPLLSRLTIQINEANEQVPGLTIDRRGQTVPAAMWNVPVPVDPGEYPIRVSAQGYEPWSTTVSVPAHAGAVAVTVPALKKLPESDKPAAAAPLPTAPPTAAPEPVSAPPAQATLALGQEGSAAPEERPGNGQRTAAYVLGGLGVVGLGVGTFFGVRAITKSHDTENLCSQVACSDPQAQTSSDDAKSAARVSNVAFIAAGALLAGGLVLYLTAPRSAPAAAGTALHASLGLRGVSLEGSF